jgi:electron transport complex protein RnfG
MHVSKDGGDVDAITASTITSRAFLESVRRAYDTFKAAVPAQEEQPAATSEQETEGGEL